MPLWRSVAKVRAMLTLADFNTLTFDCYGTLIDWERGILDAIRPWLARHGLQHLSDPEILEAFASFEGACESETPAAPYPAILGYLQRIGRREAYQRAMHKGDPDLKPLLS